MFQTGSRGDSTGPSPAYIRNDIEVSEFDSARTRDSTHPTWPLRRFCIGNRGKCLPICRASGKRFSCSFLRCASPLTLHASGAQQTADNGRKINNCTLTKIEFGCILKSKANDKISQPSITTIINAVQAINHKYSALYTTVVIKRDSTVIKVLTTTIMTCRYSVYFYSDLRLHIYLSVIFSNLYFLFPEHEFWS